MRHSKSKLGLLATSLLMTSIATAKPVTVKDWSLDDTGPICIASTTRIVDGQTYRFELTFDKSGAYPAEAWIREVPSTTTTKGFRLITEVKPVQSFAFSTLQDASGNVTFWQIPADTNSLVSYIKRQTRLLVQALTPNGAEAPLSKQVDFSLRGSSDVVNALVTNCAKGKSLVQAEFEKSFVPNLTAPLDPLKLDEIKTAHLRSLYQNSIAANAQKAALLKELTTLNSQYAKQIQELAKVTGTLDQLTQKELVRLQTQKTTVEAKIKTLEQQLVNQDNVIKAKEGDVAVANAAYDKAWGILSPLESEHQRLAGLIRDAKKDLSANQDRLESINDEIRSQNNRLSDYNDSLNSLRSQLSQVESVLRSAAMDAEFTDRNYRYFDGSRQRDDLYRIHPVVEYCRRERSSECSRLLNSASSSIESEVSKVQSRLYDNVNSARRVYSEKQSLVEDINSKIRSINNYDIPNTQNTISNLRSQRSSAENAIARSEGTVSSRTSALQSYDSSVQYAAKKADVEAKSTVVLKLQKDLKSLEADKSTLAKTRTQQVALLASTDKQIQDTLVKIQTSQDRESVLNKALVPYFAEKLRIDTAVAQVDAAILANKTEFGQTIAASPLAVL
ncbi:MAG: hypothetical protein ACKOX6_09300 [Bdellovibrio sp.]